MIKINGISLQINLSPSDFLLCKSLLPYQIEFFYEQVDEVVLTIETKKSNGKRFGSNFEENEENLYAFLKTLVLGYPKIRIVPVDYGKASKIQVSKAFFSNTKSIPDKDFRGGPFYCYFFGMFSCNYQKILHLDCDMILGGEAKYWLKGAIELLKNPSVSFVLPLPGPPSYDFTIKQAFHERINRFTYSFDHFTSRVFLTDFDKLTAQKLRLKFIKPSLRKYLRALIQRNFWELPEMLITDVMRETNMKRLDYWGENDMQGCFSLHPLQKTNAFLLSLPHILNQIKINNIPEDQKGFYNIKDEVFWSANRQMNSVFSPIKRSYPPSYNSLIE